MSDDRSPTKNTLRGMLLRRSMTKRDPKPKRVKRSRTANATSAKLLKLLQENFSESSLSDDCSTTSSGPF
nr:ORF3 [Torque teno felis virus]QYD02001.1 ORF3 [Torque teno felis virus]